MSNKIFATNFNKESEARKVAFSTYKVLCEKIHQLALKKYINEGLLETELTENSKASVEYFQKELGYFIPYHHLIGSWVENGVGFHVSDVRDAMHSFERLCNDELKVEYDWMINRFSRLSKIATTTQKQTFILRSEIYEVFSQ